MNRVQAMESLQEAQAATDRALAEYIEQRGIRDAETTGKLKGLIELMASSEEARRRYRNDKPDLPAASHQDRRMREHR